MYINSACSNSKVSSTNNFFILQNKSSKSCPGILTIPTKIDFYHLFELDQPSLYLKLQFRVSMNSFVLILCLNSFPIQCIENIYIQNQKCLYYLLCYIYKLQYLYIKTSQFPLSPFTYPSHMSVSNIQSPHSRKHINSTSISSNENQHEQQQLRALLALLEQYNQNYHEMMDEDKDTIKEVANFEEFVEKIKAKSQSELHIIYSKWRDIRKMLEEVLTKSLAILPQAIHIISEGKSKLQAITQQLDDKQLVIQGLKEKKMQIEKHLSEISMMYEKSRYDNMELSQKMNRKQQQFETESREIRKTFMEVSQQNEAEKKILQQLYESNEKLNHSLSEAKSEKKQIQKENYKLSLQLSKAKTKIQSLEIQLDKRQVKIRNYENQLESLHISRRKQSGQSMGSNPNEDQDPYLRQSFTDAIDQKKNDKIKLNQELHNYKLPTVKDLNGSFIMGTGMRRSVGDESDYASEYEQPTKVNQSLITQNQSDQEKILDIRFNKKKDISDPYFSHYILISQSVKIKEDCEDMLNIDMKPYYQEIIDKRIPMHLWDQWIKNRLRELLRKNEMRE